jgi:hypothetical protein
VRRQIVGQISVCWLIELSRSFASFPFIRHEGRRLTSIVENKDHPLIYSLSIIHS